MLVIGDPSETVRRAVTSVFEGAHSSGAAEPAMLAIDDDTVSWLEVVASRPRSERARSVLATGEESSLVAAIRLSIGGAAWLPCSSLSALEALGAAAREERAFACLGSDALDRLAAAERVEVLHFAEHRLWRRQVGRDRLEQWLATLAEALGITPVILAWPALIVAHELEPRRVHAAWHAVLGERRRPLPELLQFSVGGGLDAVAELVKGLCDGVAEHRVRCEIGRAPVRELPGGRLIGWWVRGGEQAGGDGWRAWPGEVVSDGLVWRLDGHGEDGVVVEASSSAAVAEAGEVAAVRMPGWATRTLGNGSPSGILAGRLAEAAQRRGVPLWIPNLEASDLRFVLGLPGTLWVDGDAVPE